MSRHAPATFLRPAVVLLAVGLVLPIVLSLAAGLLGVEPFECWCRSEAAPNAAAPVGVSGRFIKLAHPEVRCLQFADLKVTSVANGPNIAKGALVTASSAYDAGAFPNSNLVDENTGNFAHTSCKDVPWFLVDLGKVVPIYNVTLANRGDCCRGRANGVVLSILDANQMPVYTARPISDVNGSTASRDDSAKTFAVFDFFPPNAAVVGSSPS